jgi:TetR/AcrR family transcriptional regulator, transcriptional repressor for nem operon
MNSTKEYIIDQSFRLFLSRSYEAVSISDISKAIGFTKGALYHHFKNKEELFNAVIDKHFVLVGVDVDVNTTTLKKYNELTIEHARNTLNTIFHNAEFNPINYLSLIADTFRHYQRFADEKIELFENEIIKNKAILDHAIKNGEIRSDINTSIIAQHYFSTTLGLAGEIMRNRSIGQAVNSLKDQLNEIYKLMKI